MTAAFPIARDPDELVRPACCQRTECHANAFDVEVANAFRQATRGIETLRAMKARHDEFDQCGDECHCSSATLCVEAALHLDAARIALTTLRDDVDGKRTTARLQSFWGEESPEA